MRHRVERVEQEIQKELNDILLKKVRDPRVQDVTITGVDVTNDIGYANVYYSILSDKASDAKKAQDGLDNAKGLIRHELSSRLTVYRIPELTFKQDDSIRYGAKIDQLINDLKSKEK